VAARLVTCVRIALIDNCDVIPPCTPKSLYQKREQQRGIFHHGESAPSSRAPEYVEDFLGAVVTFLAFNPNHADLADRVARAVEDHATPVGTGTVSRIKRIPVEQRAEATVIAWMSHQTTRWRCPRQRGIGERFG
jgi:hypothetical protein